MKTRNGFRTLDCSVANPSRRFLNPVRVSYWTERDGMGQARRRTDGETARRNPFKIPASRLVPDPVRKGEARRGAVDSPGPEAPSPGKGWAWPPSPKGAGRAPQCLPRGPVQGSRVTRVAGVPGIESDRSGLETSCRHSYLRAGHSPARLRLSVPKLQSRKDVLKIGRESAHTLTGSRGERVSRGTRGRNSPSGARNVVATLG